MCPKEGLRLIHFRFQLLRGCRFFYAWSVHATGVKKLYHPFHIWHCQNQLIFGSKLELQLEETWGSSQSKTTVSDSHANYTKRGLFWIQYNNSIIGRFNYCKTYGPTALSVRHHQWHHPRSHYHDFAYVPSPSPSPKYGAWIPFYSFPWFTSLAISLLFLISQYCYWCAPLIADWTRI